MGIVSEGIGGDPIQSDPLDDFDDDFEAKLE